MADWLDSHVFVDTDGKYPEYVRFNFHSRSNHGETLSRYIFDDLGQTCPTLANHAQAGAIGYGIEYRAQWPNGKEKTLDLAVGIPLIPNRRDLFEEPPYQFSGYPRKPMPRADGTTPPVPSPNPSDLLRRLLLVVEVKTVMTEHGKAQPRVFSELNDAHVIVHAGDRYTLSAGVTIVNIAQSFVSPGRQKRGQAVVVNRHVQPRAAEAMTRHLRGLRIRRTVREAGLDAYATVLVDLKNDGFDDGVTSRKGDVWLHTTLPAPQPGDPDHYEAFLHQLCGRYCALFANLDDLPPDPGAAPEDRLVGLERARPGLLREVALATRDRGIPESGELGLLFDELAKDARIRLP